MKYLKLFEQYNNDNFAKWFGGSKMVDKDGKPRVFYHGVGRAGKFTEFRDDFIGASSGNEGHFGRGFYFADTLKAGKIWSDYFGGTGGVLEVYLKIEKPFVVSEENLYQIAKKHGLKFPEKVEVAIEINDLLSKLKNIDPIAYKLMSYMYQENDISKGWTKFLKEHDRVHVGSTGIDLNNVTDWYEATLGERYNQTVDEYTIEELKEIGIEPKFIYDFNETPRMEYLTDLGQNAIYWSNAIKEEGYDGIDAGDEIVVFKPTQIKSVDNNGNFDPNNPNINENSDI